MTCPSTKPPPPLRLADDRDPRVAAFHRDFPGWKVWGRGGSFCAMRTGARDGLVGVTAASLAELRMRLREALEATS